jgi:hypothetical protein
MIFSKNKILESGELLDHDLNIKIIIVVIIDTTDLIPYEYF